MTEKTDTNLNHIAPDDQVSGISEYVNLPGQAALDPTDEGQPGKAAEDEAEQVKNPEAEPPVIEWEELGDGQRRYANFITDLPPEAFATHWPPAPNGGGNHVAPNGERHFEFGINARALGEVEPGTYRIRYSVDGDVDVEIIRDEANDHTYFSFSYHEIADEEAAKAEYKALAGSPPEALRMPYTSINHYFRIIAEGFPNDTPEDVLSTSKLQAYLYIGLKEQEVDGQNRRLIPSPQTLEKIAEERSLPIRLIHSGPSHRSYIEPRLYQQAFEDGLYPVGSADLLYYLHDIDNDHLPGAMTGHYEPYPKATGFLELISPAVAKINAKNMNAIEDLEFATSYMTEALDLLNDCDTKDLKSGDIISGVETKLASLYEKAEIDYDRDYVRSVLYMVLASYARQFSVKDKVGKANALDDLSDRYRQLSLTPALQQAA